MQSVVFLVNNKIKLINQMRNFNAIRKIYDILELYLIFQKTYSKL